MIMMMQRVKGKSYQSGQVPDTLTSQGSTHCGWNLWSQGNTRTSSPTLKSSVQIEHPRPSSLPVPVPAPAPTASLSPSPLEVLEDSVPSLRAPAASGLGIGSMGLSGIVDR